MKLLSCKPGRIRRSHGAAEELSHTSGALRLTLEGVRRIYKCRLEECHRATCLAHFEDASKQRGGESRSTARPHFVPEFLAQRGRTGLLPTSARRTFLPELRTSAAKHVQNVSVWGVCSMRGMYTA